MFADAHHTGRLVNLDPARTRDAAFTHTAGDYRRMAGCSSMRGQKADGCVHAMDVIGGRFLPHQDDR